MRQQQLLGGVFCELLHSSRHHALWCVQQWYFSPVRNGHSNWECVPHSCNGSAKQQPVPSGVGRRPCSKHTRFQFSTDFHFQASSPSSSPCFTFTYPCFPSFPHPPETPRHVRSLAHVAMESTTTLVLWGGGLKVSSAYHHCCIHLPFHFLRPPPAVIPVHSGGGCGNAASSTWESSGRTLRTASGHETYRFLNEGSSTTQNLLRIWLR
jgi:hypothetical protein